MAPPVAQSVANIANTPKGVCSRSFAYQVDRRTGANMFACVRLVRLRSHLDPAIQRTRQPQRHAGCQAMTTDLYGTSSVKRQRVTGAELKPAATLSSTIVEEIQPCTVRQTFYQCTVHGVVEKSEDGYRKVQRDLSEMRRNGELPYGWIVDNTRWQRKPRTFDSVEDALHETARFYRKALWADNGCSARSGSKRMRWRASSCRSPPVRRSADGDERLFQPIVPVHRGRTHHDADVPTFIIHLGDYDPSGSMPVKRSRRHCTNSLPMRKSTSSASP